MPRTARIILLVIALASWGCSSTGSSERYAWDAEPAMETSQGLLSMPEVATARRHTPPRPAPGRVANGHRRLSSDGFCCET